MGLERIEAPSESKGGLVSRKVREPVHALAPPVLRRRSNDTSPAQNAPITILTTGALRTSGYTGFGTVHTAARRLRLLLIRLSSP